MCPALCRTVPAYLPADSGAEVLHSHPVVGPGGRAVLVQPGGSGVSSPSPAVSPVPGPVTPGAPGVLYRYSLAQQLLSGDSQLVRRYSPLAGLSYLPIEFVDGIVSVPVVLKLNKSKSLLDEHIRGPAVALEKPLHVLLSDPGWHVADIDTASWHDSALQ